MDVVYSATEEKQDRKKQKKNNIETLCVYRVWILILILVTANASWLQMIWPSILVILFCASIIYVMHANCTHTSAF